MIVCLSVVDCSVWCYIFVSFVVFRYCAKFYFWKLKWYWCINYLSVCDVVCVFKIFWCVFQSVPFDSVNAVFQSYDIILAVVSNQNSELIVWQWFFVNNFCFDYVRIGIFRQIIRNCVALVICNRNSICLEICPADFFGWTVFFDYNNLHFRKIYCIALVHFNCFVFRWYNLDFFDIWIILVIIWRFCCRFSCRLCDSTCAHSRTRYTVKHFFWVVFVWHVRFYGSWK